MRVCASPRQGAPASPCHSSATCTREFTRTPRLFCFICVSWETSLFSDIRLPRATLLFTRFGVFPTVGARPQVLPDAQLQLAPNKPEASGSNQAELFERTRPRVSNRLGPGALGP